MPIEASVSGGSPITASVGETQIDVAAGSTAAQVAVNVSGGFGPSGSNGSAGAAATVAVGSVTTGAAGSSASVTNAGSSSAAVFNFTIPAGATGPQGPAGPAGSNATLPTATASVLGGVKIGSGVTIDGNGVISVAAANQSLDTSSNVAFNRVTTTDVYAPTASTQLHLRGGRVNAYGGLSVILASGYDFMGAVFSVNSSGVVNLGTWRAIPVEVAYGGTGASTASDARTNLGLAIGTDVAAASHTHAASAISDSTAAGRALLTGGDAAAQRTSLGLGSLATQSGTFSGTSSGTNTGDQTITLTGDVTGSGTGSFAATLSSTGVTAGTFTSVTVDAKGRVTAGSSPAVAYSSLSGTPSTFTPSAHKASHATGGADALTAADIGAAATSHAHGAGDITGGTLAAARLPIVLEQTQAVGNSGTSTTLYLTTGSVQTVTLNGNCTFTMPTATAGASITLILTQSGTFTATFTGVLWAGGTAPTITATASKVDVLVFISNGTSWFGTAAQNF
jgi:hypothetical protein